MTCVYNGSRNMFVPAGSQLSDVDCQVTSVCACALVYLGEQVS